MTQVVAEQDKTKQQQEVHIVIVSNDPERVYPAVTLALGAISMGSKASLYCTMSGLDVVRKDAGDRIKFPGMPPLDKYVKDAIAAGTNVCACAPSKEMLAQMGISTDTVLPGVTI